MTAQACRFAFNEMQMLIKNDTNKSFVANEKMRFGFANPAKLQVDLSFHKGSTTINVKSSNLGIGPIQGGHVKGVSETFISNVKMQINKTQPASPMESIDLASQLEKLADLKAKGLLTEEEFAVAKAKLL